MIIELDAEITEDGELKVKLPEGIPPGKVHLKIEAVGELPEIAPTWTDEEIAEMIHIEPMTSIEIVAAGLTGGWEDMGITDSVAWLKEQREKRQRYDEDRKS